MGRALLKPAPPALRRAVASAYHGKRHHCIISGTGRAGTSFLVQILSRLGCDTGFAADNLPLHSAARAGLEIDIRQDDAPYIVKNPWLCDYIEEILARDDIVIDRAFIPMRSIAAAAESRAHVERLSRPTRPTGSVPGGLWAAATEQEQEAVLLGKFYALLWPLVRHGVPVTFLSYPRLVQDPRYLYDQLKVLLPGVSYATFRDAWRDVVRPEWVHRFSDDDVAAAPARVAGGDF